MPDTWLRCVDHTRLTGSYYLNPANVVYLKRDDDGGWWRAYDVTGHYHVIASEDDRLVEALTGRREGGAP